jgi:two-component sensor histidine kinase
VANIKGVPAAGLLIAVVVASLVPFLLVGSYLLFSYVGRERDAALDRVRVLADAISATVDRELTGRMETLQALATSPYLRHADLEQFASMVDAASSVAHGDFVLVDRSGEQLVNTRAEPGSPLGRSLDPDVMRFIFEQGRPHVSNLQDEHSAGRHTFTLRIPVRVDGKIVYAFGYSPRTTKVLNVLHESSLPSEWFAAVLDRRGRIIARSSRNEEFAGRPASPDFVARLTGSTGQIESVDLEGRQTVTAYRRSGLTEWTTTVWVPKSVLQERATMAANAIGALALVTLLLSLAAGYVVSRVIRRPTRQLIMSAAALKKGNIVRFEPTIMREANVVGEALADASRDIQLYMREISHRSKNLLAIVQAISRQTQRSSGDLATFSTRFDNRLQSLARSHDLLVDRNWSGVLVHDLVSAQLASFLEPGDGRVRLAGPPVLLNPAASQHIGLAIHELATNATKYGALSVAEGRVHIEWREVIADYGPRRFRMSWQETGGPSVTPSARKGFGRFVIEDAVARGLSGLARIDWAEAGLTWTLDAPSSCLVGEGPFRLEESQNEPGGPPQYSQTASPVL